MISVGSRPSCAIQSLVVMDHTINPCIWESHAFNFSTREMEMGDAGLWPLTGKDMTGRREKRM